MRHSAPRYTHNNRRMKFLRMWAVPAHALSFMFCYVLHSKNTPRLKTRGIFPRLYDKLYQKVTTSSTGFSQGETDSTCMTGPWP